MGPRQVRDKKPCRAPVCRRTGRHGQKSGDQAASMGRNGSIADLGCRWIVVCICDCLFLIEKCQGDNACTMQGDFIASLYQHFTGRLASQSSQN